MIQKMRFLTGVLTVALTCFIFTACESDEDDATQVITFEDVDLGTSGYWNGSDLSGTSSTYESYGQTVTEYDGSFKSGALTCNNVYNATWYSWSGMACSNHTDMDSIGYGNQYSVYASSGAAGSEQFGLIGSDGAGCTFDQSVEIKSLMVNNSTYVYHALKEGNDGYGLVTQFAAGDYFYMTITGYDSTGVETGTVDFYLADFRDSKTYICSDWTKVSLESLGSVKTLSFSFTSTDTGDYGINTPIYACIDNLVYENE